jgi:hypothetical protein
MLLLGQSRPCHSAPVPANVRYASNSDHSRHEPELTLCAIRRHCDTSAPSPNIRQKQTSPFKREPRPFTLFWLKAFRLEHGSSDRSFKKLDERLRRLGCIGAGPDSGREERHACELSRQRAYQLRPGHGHDLRGLRDTDLGFTPGYDLAGLGTWHQNGFRFQLLGESQSFDDVRKITARYRTIWVATV